MNILVFGILFLAASSNNRCIAGIDDAVDATGKGIINAANTVGGGIKYAYEETPDVAKGAIAAGAGLAVAGGAYVVGKKIVKAATTPKWIKNVVSLVKSFDKLEGQCETYDKLKNSIKTLEASPTLNAEPTARQTITGNYPANNLKKARAKAQSFVTKVAAFAERLNIAANDLARYIIYMEFINGKTSYNSVEKLYGFPSVNIPDAGAIVPTSIASKADKTAYTYQEAYEFYYRNYRVEIQNGVIAALTKPAAVKPAAPVVTPAPAAPTPQITQARVPSTSSARTRNTVYRASSRDGRA